MVTKVNMEKFVNRLTEILEFYNLSASAFADKIKVQRSSISHLLSGRNKPSLDFVLRVVSAFPEVDLYWILQGKGVFPIDKNNVKTEGPTLEKMDDLKNTTISSTKKTIEKIVIFYSDGTFEPYKSN